MIIEAVRIYLANRNTPSELHPEELADLIADRLSKTLTVSSPTPGSDTKAETPNEDAFDAALDFINSF